MNIYTAGASNGTSSEGHVLWLLVGTGGVSRAGLRWYLALCPHKCGAFAEYEVFDLVL